MMKHFLSIADLAPDELHELLNLALDLKEIDAMLQVDRQSQ